MGSRNMNLDLEVVWECSEYRWWLKPYVQFYHETREERDEDQTLTRKNSLDFIVSYRIIDR